MSMREIEFKAAHVSQNIILRRARDMTEATTSRSTLVIAPHPDDETLGCGSTIARKRAAGTPVHICVVSDGGAFPTDEMSSAELVRMREKNFAAACEVLGADDNDVELLGFPDAGTSAQIGAITSALAATIARVQPDEILLPSIYDAHRDHVAVHKAAMAAVEQVATTAKLYTYLVWFWARETWNNDGALDQLLHRFRIIAAGLRVRPATVATAQFLEQKRSAMDCYSWELIPDRDYFELWSLTPEEIFFVTKVGARRKA